MSGGGPRDFRFSIDRGGTFTDVYSETPNGPRVFKLLSVDPANYADAPTEGIRRVLAAALGEEKFPRGKPIDTSRIAEIRMGTTVATNALLERQGERCALVTTKGFGDLLCIGNQARPQIFELAIQRPELLYEQVVELDERVVVAPLDEEPASGGSGATASGKVVHGSTGERLRVESSLDEAACRDALRSVRQSGISSVAVVLMHSYTFAAHERRVGELAKEEGFTQVSLSTELMPMVRIVPRGRTAVVDAYLTPVLRRYIEGFCRGFDANLLKNCRVLFMRSDGGLAHVDNFTGHSSILSGPAGGVVGIARTSGELRAAPEHPPQCIGFDMGGTSTDVSRFAGAFEHTYETTTAGVTIQSPQLDINTVAAGGGSRLFYRRGLMDVGPESAGAHPGPVCYRKEGGVLAVTDANVVLGRVLPKFFPKIFGPREDQPLDAEAAKKAMQAIADQINAEAKSRDGASAPQKSLEEVASGFLRVANEAMARPIRNLTVSRGYDCTAHVLTTFGGAGPQHCCAIARILGMRKIAVHRYAGILSAYGISLADVVSERQTPLALRCEKPDWQAEAAKQLAALEATASADLAAQGFPPERIAAERFLNLRYEGTDTALMTRAGSDGDFLKAFLENYRREFGFELKGRPVVVDDARVRGLGLSRAPGSKEGSAAKPPASLPPPPQPIETTQVYFDGRWCPSPVHRAEELRHGHEITGPAIIMQDLATIVVEPGCVARVDAEGNLEIDVPAGGGERASEALDPIWLAVFAHRFMGIAEQMGRRLQRTSVSVNIKERLDFSCAVFAGDGSLIANAPHLPVHLGAMQEAVKFQIRYWAERGEKLLDGDVLVSNHPLLAGGSHLPDITVITPVFQPPGSEKPTFFVASRGHHADVGGIAPGSMPPFSTNIDEEGAQIVGFKLVRDGVFQEEGISELLLAPGKIAGCSGTRCLADNLSDLKAQVAANTRGTELLRELCSEHGLNIVLAYMKHIMAHAEHAVRGMLRDFSTRRGLPEVGSVSAEDFLDDGTRIALTVTIDRAKGSAIFDFEGTSSEMMGNLNAPPAVTYSAIIYCLRCLLADHDIPLNQGCLAPIEVRIPSGTVLRPSLTAATVGGNVETSQRITDVIFRAFEACAASQGTMNNLTFGDDKFGYYETICGGSGATADHDGVSGVHTHMTNTRITDPEIFERRYPVTLRRFSLRQGSGGAGHRRGGDGIVREVQFRRPLRVSILSERRALQPYGLAGGLPGARGDNVLQKAGNGRVSRIGAKRMLEVDRGDTLTILTPGGGGFGTPNGDGGEPPKRRPRTTSGTGSLHQYKLDQEQA